MDTPLIIYVSGAPGSGKTTLAAKLAEHMRLLHIKRDEFFWSLNYTYDRNIDRGKEGIPVYFDLLKSLLDRGVSVVTDGTIYRGISEKDISGLQANARLVNVHCRANNVHERFYEREVARNGGTEPAWLPEHMEHLRKIHEDAADPLQIGCELIEVDTNDGYNPTIASIANIIGDRNSQPRKGKVYATKES